MTTGNPMLDYFEEVFNGQGGDYNFTMSHVAISGRDVECELARDGTGEWVLTQREHGREWTARHESKMAAVLLLIAARLGLEGELHPMDETP
jgi:hypothetical protein